MEVLENKIIRPNKNICNSCKYCYHVDEEEVCMQNLNNPIKLDFIIDFECECYTERDKEQNEQETTICETNSNTQEKIIEILSAMTDLLLYKNEKYGDSALKPNNIFYKGDATNSILIRLDDKIGRIRNNPDIAVNDVCDIIGYCTLLLASMDVTEQEIEKLKD